MATRFHHTTATTFALAALLAGCAHPSYRNDSGDGAAGAAVRATLAAQVANPAARHSGDPSIGLDGSSARAANQRYENVQATPSGGVAAGQSIIK
jgi:hypothetical protein